MAKATDGSSTFVLLRVGRVSVVTRCCILGPAVISVSVWLPIPSRLSACCCLDRHCVLKSLAAPREIVTTQSLPSIFYAYLSAARNTFKLSVCGEPALVLLGKEPSDDLTGKYD